MDQRHRRLTDIMHDQCEMIAPRARSGIYGIQHDVTLNAPARGDRLSGRPNLRVPSYENGHSDSFVCDNCGVSSAERASIMGCNALSMMRLL